MTVEDRTLELHTNASQGALEYLRLAKLSLETINDPRIKALVDVRLDGLMKAVENFHTEAARKLRYQQSKPPLRQPCPVCQDRPHGCSMCL